MKGLNSQWPEPGRFWIRFRPREWPGPAEPWTDLATAELGAVPPPGAPPRGFPALADEAAVAELDDRLYLPPVPAELAAERDRLARVWIAAEVPLLVQLRPGEAWPEYPAVFVYDLLPALAAGDLDTLDSLPAGSTVAWPLVAGLTDEPSLWRRGLERLRSAGVETVQPISLTLSPAAARRLAEGRSAEVFQALFHRESRPARDLARLAHAAGFRVWVPRPAASPALARPRNRELAGELVEAADLALDLGRPVGWSLGLLRAARWIDAAPYDVAALAREGNLGVVPELDPTSRALAEEWTATGRLAILDELRREFLEGG